MKVRSQPAAGSIAATLLGAAVLQASAGGLQPQGGEFPLTRGIPGDQVNPAIVLRDQGGLLFWQDAAIDGDGLGIAGVRVDGAGGSTLGSIFRVNQSADGDQENVAAAALPGGRTFVVWQGGKQGFQHIHGRIIDAHGTAAGADLPLSQGSGEHQIDPAVATLSDGSVVVAWASYRQGESYGYDVYGRHFSADGVALGDEFRLNATQGMNRRSPALAALANGGFAAGWIAERQVGIRDNLGNGGVALAGAGAPTFEVALVVRSFEADGSAQGAEVKVSDVATVASNPALAGLNDGRVVAAWTRRSSQVVANGLDVASRLLGTAGEPLGSEQLVNVTLVGDQFRPRIAASVHGAILVWSSMGQDGSWEGVYGRWLDDQGTPVGDEIPINGQTGGGQILPAVASAPDASLLVAWSSNLPRTGYELFAQRFAPLLLRAEAGAGGQLKLSWPAVAGGVYQLQSSRDGSVWNNVGGTRTAPGSADAVEVSVSGQMVLYRVLRAR